MKKLLLTLGLMAVLVQGAGAWRPAGWVYHNHPWAYDSATGDWHWFNTVDRQWVVNMSNGQWARLPNSAMATGWVFYNWAFAYAQRNGAWHWINGADRQWVVNMRTAAWSRFGVGGVPPVPVGFVRVEGGVGSNITVSHSFYMGKHEVTWAEWQAVQAWAVTNDYVFSGNADGCATNHPVQSVNWYDVVKWCNAKSEKEGLTPVYTVSGVTYRTGEQDNVDANVAANGVRLPTWDEWRFAAEGGIHGQGYTYSGGDVIGDVAWFVDNSIWAACGYGMSDRGTWPVGQKAANELGIHDMTGNVWEWTFTEAGPDTRYCPGGSWWSTAGNSLPGTAWNRGAEQMNTEVGFRIVRNAP